MSAFGIDIDARAVRVFDDQITRDLALDQLVDAVASTGAISEVDSLRTAIRDREESMSTGIGGGVAIPHVRIRSVIRPVVGVGVSKKGMDFRAADEKPVHVIVLFAMPPDSNKLYLGLLAQVMVALKAPNFLDRLIGCGKPQEVVAVLNESAG
ncbi:MAG: PTS sugar transporter subunit IIA [Candidatus Hydrogenedentes bacterium]|nr:PTS sugar transporter subunit IIA [Candidatus Hydrogenedentota bacterium]